MLFFDKLRGFTVFFNNLWGGAYFFGEPLTALSSALMAMMGQTEGGIFFLLKKSRRGRSFFLDMSEEPQFCFSAISNP